MVYSLFLLPLSSPQKKEKEKKRKVWMKNEPPTLSGQVL